MNVRSNFQFFAGKDTDIFQNYPNYVAVHCSAADRGECACSTIVSTIWRDICSSTAGHQPSLLLCCGGSPVQQSCNIFVICSNVRTDKLNIVRNYLDHLTNDLQYDNFTLREATEEWKIDLYSCLQSFLPCFSRAQLH